MNKYQEFLLEKYVRIFVYKELKSDEAKYSSHIENGSFELKQDDNYHITKYSIGIFGLPVLHVELNGQKYKPNENGLTRLELDFEDQCKELVLYAKDDIIEPIHVSIIYTSADKSAYDAKLAAESRAALRAALVKKASIGVGTGESLITVRFKPVSDAYAYSKVELYSENQLMAKFKTDEDVFFKSITDLAYGVYRVKLVQYTSGNDVLFESDLITVELKRPSNPGDGRRSIRC
jgi:hypothetical protein